MKKPIKICRRNFDVIFTRFFCSVAVPFSILTVEAARHNLGVLKLVKRAVYNFVPTSFGESRTGTINVNVLL